MALKFDIFNQKNDDPEKIFRLFEKVYGNSNAIRNRWNWEFIDHPQADKIRLFTAACEDGELAGLTVRMPCDLRIGKNIYSAFFATNSMVSPAFRGKGVIVKLYQLASEDNALHLSKGTSPAMYRQLLKIGYQEIKPNCYQTALISPLKWLTKRLFCCSFENKQKPLDYYEEYSLLSKFGVEHSSILLPALILPVHTEDWLTWRYLKTPNRHYLVYERRDHGRIVAWFVMRLEGSLAALTDLRWSSNVNDEPMKTIGFCKALARLHNADRLDAWFSFQKLRQILSKKFFIIRKKTPHFSFFSRDRIWNDITWAEAFFVQGDGDIDYL